MSGPLTGVPALVLGLLVTACVQLGVQGAVNVTTTINPVTFVHPTAKPTTSAPVIPTHKTTTVSPAQPTVKTTTSAHVVPTRHFSATAFTTTEIHSPVTVVAAHGSTSQEVCDDRINTCSQYGQTPCTSKVYEAWAKHNCALYCGFCQPNITNLDPSQCRDKVPNCPEYDGGDLCTAATYYSWAYDNCRSYCKFGQCNDTVCKDQAGLDCESIDQALNLCADRQKAKLVCRNYCNLCNLTDGVWGSWASWGDCSVSCGDGTQTRARDCNNPPPSDGGSDCEGDASEDKACTRPVCPVHGNWSSWSEWSTCSVKCGQGLQRRDRHCNNPPPSRQGDHCFGNPSDFRLCTQAACFVLPGTWSTWSEWSQCSSTRGSLRFRDRNCTTTAPVNQGGQCVGSSVETGSCKNIVGMWSLWSDWSLCSSASNVRVRVRTCTEGQCIGGTIESGSCNNTVRIVGGSNRYNGRLEIFHNDTWGTVCDDYFTNTAATVVCNMLSYRGSGAHFRTETHLSPPSKVWLDDVRCLGNESNIAECTHLNWGEGDCGHGEDVSVYCPERQDTPLRLIGGQYNGRLEVFHEGLWGTVCNSGFTNSTAREICRLLNYGTENVYFTSHSSSYPPTTVWLNYVKCNGSVSDIGACGHNTWTTTSCSHSSDVYIFCSSPNLHSFTATRPIAGAAPNSVTFSTMVSSVGSDYNTSTGTFTCSSQGTYSFTVSLTKNSGYSFQFVHCFLRLNGGNMILINMNSGMYFASVSGTFHLAIGDEIDISNCSGVEYLDSSTSVFTAYQVNIN